MKKHIMYLLWGLLALGVVLGVVGLFIGLAMLIHNYPYIGFPILVLFAAYMLGASIQHDAGR